MFFCFLGEQEACDWGRICTVLLTNLVKPPNESCETGREEATSGPLPHRGGRVSDDVIMTGFGWFASLLMSSTGASNRTFLTQLRDGERGFVFSLVTTETFESVSDKPCRKIRRENIFIRTSTKHQEENKLKQSETFETKRTSCKRALKMRMKKTNVSWWTAGRRKMTQTQQNMFFICG